jgi:hypothetical protein
MDSDYYTSDDENEIKISDIPVEVIRLYENGLKKNTLESVSEQIIYLLDIYNYGQIILFGLY